MKRNKQAVWAAYEKKLDQPVHFLRKREVCARVGLSNSELHRRIAAGDFPAPIKLGDRCRAVGFSSAEIEAWMAARVAARNEGGAA
ncbi:Excisionase family DNA binding domain-containing protein [Lysobacter dokdonensis DS-58]|uniref:Excisionase family DNA binding domain-containing protein n=1 Tax=Lysobacter dokdonensis DS-58 TaxID=1300345 RepID=A0A0A2WKI3_9GAMM|nr:AlpA family phage regulatory protein [Lysobacter dokdonensis]KGQ20661.1 Excisionase family DNA binding domain-containing protein [Lysobacter dokdonensis DS-58]